jgi:hypothetical protein
MVGPDAGAASDAGRLVIDGCVMQEDGLDPDWECTGWSRHRWKADNEALWELTVSRALEEFADDQAREPDATERK